jgi:hypothetical protein
MNFMKAAGMAVGGLFVGLIVVLIGIIGIFLFAIFGALIGAITGWIVGQTPILGEAVKNGFTSIFEVESPDLVAIGAMLGFIAGFFKQWDTKDGGKEKHEHHAEHAKEWCEDVEMPEVHIDIEPKKSKKSKKK